MRCVEGGERGSPPHEHALTCSSALPLASARRPRQVKRERSLVTAKHKLRTLLEQLLATGGLPALFQLPLGADPRFTVCGIEPENCSVMDSKMRPLMLAFVRPCGATTRVLFKKGDDLRQDQLTLQVLRVMDSMWERNGLSLELSPYRVVATGDAVGMIEVVEDSETIAKIMAGVFTGKAGKLMHGGLVGKLQATLGAASKKSVREWLLAAARAKCDAAVADAEDWPSRQRLNSSLPDAHSAAVHKAVETFAVSCAGYCVATYVLGIGDRHPANIMLSKDGRLFHIDFGHFLGHFKSKLGVKRERSPFIFTPAFKKVIETDTVGGESSGFDGSAAGSDGAGRDRFAYFVSTCSAAFNIVRNQAGLIHALFALMLSCGMPELQTSTDIAWLDKTMDLALSDDDAAAKFSALISKSIGCAWTQLNDAAHLLNHY